MRVDRERVDAVEPLEERRRRGRRRGGRAVGAVHVQPDAVLGADVGERIERIDRAGARRARHADHGDRRDAGGESVSIARASSSGRTRNASSQRIARSARRPSPSTSQARAIELWACSEA